MPIVEDAAQAIGATLQGPPGRGRRRVGCFSFFPTKNLGAFGDGGLVTTTTRARRTRCALLRNHGAEPKYLHQRIGGNFRLDALQAAVLRVKLPHLPVVDRRPARERRALRALFADAGARAWSTLPGEPAGYTHLQPVRDPGAGRDASAHELAAHGIGTEIYYPVPFHLQECFADLGYRRGAFPGRRRPRTTAWRCRSTRS